MDRTLLIGLDGATFAVLDALMDDGTMPFLADLVRGGVRGELLSTPNPLTPPAWTSLMTGRSPGEHGIVDFIWAEERGSEVYFTLNTYSDIRCDTIWSMVSRQHRRAAVLNFPVTAPPPRINGVVIPGLVSWKHLRRNVHPPELFAQLKALPGFDPKELAWDFELEKKALQVVPREEYEAWLRFHIARERQWFEVLRYTLRHEPSELTAIVFDGSDKIQHICWRFLEAAGHAGASEWDRRIRDLCLEYFRRLDGYLRECVALAGPDTRVFLVSDHGFGPTEEIFRVNTWLAQRGYLRWKPMDALDGAARESAARLLNGNFVLLDWANTTAYARTPATNGIWIRVAKEAGQTGIAPFEYEGFRRRLIDELLDFRDSAGERVVAQVLTREAAFPGAWSDRAPDLTLVLRDHGFVSVLDKEPVLVKRPDTAGTHRPEGIFVAHGPGIPRGGRVPPLSILDVTPTLLYSLGMPIPDDFEGALPAAVFEPALLRARPPVAGGRAPAAPIDPAPGRGLDEEEDGLLLDRLRALGYIE